jgi:hypothetical protein
VAPVGEFRITAGGRNAMAAARAFYRGKLRRWARTQRNDGEQA